MFTTTENKTTSTVQRQRQNSNTSFFRKAGEEAFFGNQQKPSVFGPTIQAKLNISSPDDPQEKEADAMANRVMRMAEPAPASAPAANDEEKLQKKEEQKEEEVQAMTEAPGISRKCANCEEEEKVQKKHMDVIQRNEDHSASIQESAEEAGESSNIDRKAISIHRSDVIQLSGRGPPASSMQGSFTQNLSSSKGGGSALPDTTRSFMESRFQADFSGVRVHTGSNAESLSRSIHAQAFTHGNDIYFNAGKYSPHTESGGTLLAHELTHTIQQGASQNVSPKPIKRKPMSFDALHRMPLQTHTIQRSVAGVPSQLTNAVDKAKTVEGQIDANKPQADGNRTGWEHLVEIFKSTFGEDKIISGAGGTTVTGAVAEQDIKKKRETTGMIVDKSTITDRNKIPGTTTGTRDAMPSWCGIFVFWALNKSGVPMPKWKLGERMIPVEAARSPGTLPLPGDIAYRNAYSHYAIVESVNGSTVRTVNGNTAGEDNLGGQVQSIDHPLSEWTAFFNPLHVMQGSLGEGEGTGNPVPKTIAELRRENDIQTKEEKEEKPDEKVQAKPELSSWSVDTKGTLQAHAAVQKAAETEAKDDEKKDEEKPETESVQMLQKKSEDAWSEGRETETGQGWQQPFHNEQNISQPSSNISCKAEDAGIQLAENESDRGPPVQAQGENKIQRSPIDTALSHTSLGALMDCVYVTDINRTSVCLLRKASAIAMYIPGYKALRVVLGRDPISGDEVERNGRNLLDAAFDIMPGGSLIQEKLEQNGQLDAAAAWIDTKIAGLEDIVDGLFSAFDAFWNRLGITDFGSPMDVMREGVGIVFGFIGNLVDFAIDAAKEILGMIKDYLLSKIVEFIKENTNAYPLLTVILGEDPITKQRVDRNGTNILNAILELGGEEGIQQRTQMQETGTFAKVAAYIDEGIEVFSDLYQTIVNGFGAIWDIVTINALMQPLATFHRIYNVFARPVARVLDFMLRVGREILKLIKEALMQRLSAWARTVRGYALVTVIIGRDPFTGTAVPFTMENVIRGFFSLMEGGEEQYNQLKESGAIDRTVAKVTAAVRRLNMTPAAIIQLFIGLWNSFSIRDLINPIAAFRRILDQFGRPIARLIAFVIEIVKIVIEAILIVMDFPFDIINNIIAKAMAAFDRIKRDPVGFLKNLLRAIKQGFVQFFENILRHLLNGLADWVFFQLKDLGIQKPEDLSFKSILKLVIDVLGISMQRIMDKVWKKLEEKIGKEKVEKIKRMIDKLEGIWKFIRDVMERGPVAIWEFIQEKLSTLWSTILDAAKNFIMERIIGAVVTKLLSMLDPTGIMAVVNSVIAIYRAIQSFIAYLRQMLEIVNSFVEGVAEIAAGNIRVAANFIERTAGRAIPIIIGFLANQVGLGKIADKLKEIIEKIREKIDLAIDWLVDKAVNMGMSIMNRLLAMGRSARDAIVNALTPWRQSEKQFTAENGESHRIYIEASGGRPQLKVASVPTTILDFLTYWETRPGVTKKQKDAITNAREHNRDRVEPILKEISDSEKAGKPESERTPMLRRLLAQNSILSDFVKQILGSSVNLSGVIEKYAMEGLTGVYESMPVAVDDDFEADHMPQAAALQHCASLAIFNEPGINNMKRRARGAHASGGYTINLHKDRHKKGRTHGNSPGSSGRLNNFITQANAAAITSPTKDSAKARTDVVRLLKSELSDDVSWIRSRVYALPETDPVWSDIVLPDATQKKTVVDAIKGRVNGGLNQMSAQLIDNLTN